jgi:hypothetical protein
LKSLSTDNRTDEAKQKLKGSSCYSYTRVYYVDDNGDDQFIEDVTYPIRIRKYAEPPKFANVAYNPAAAEVNFQVINKNGVYSPKNSDSALSGVLVRDRVFKFYDGKYLQSLTTESSQVINLDEATLYFTQFGRDSAAAIESITLDRNNTVGTVDSHFTDWFPVYGSFNYDGDDYAPDGYALWKIDREFSHAEKFTKFIITANSTDGTIWYKLGNDEDEMNSTGTSTGWIEGGSLSVGDTTITINAENARFLWIVVIFETWDWSDSISISGLTFYYQSHIEWTLLGTFLLDDPGFGDRQSPEISMISCSGRNVYKKALETKQNIEDVDGVALDQIIKDLCDIVGINYTATSIADLSGYGN